jgi:hypothetical protein
VTMKELDGYGPWAPSPAAQKVWVQNSRGCLVKRV